MQNVLCVRLRLIKKKTSILSIYHARFYFWIGEKNQHHTKVHQHNEPMNRLKWKLQNNNNGNDNSDDDEKRRWKTKTEGWMDQRQLHQKEEQNVHNNEKWHSVGAEARPGHVSLYLSDLHAVYGYLCAHDIISSERFQRQAKPFWTCTLYTTATKKEAATPAGNISFQHFGSFSEHPSKSSFNLGIFAPCLFPTTLSFSSIVWSRCRQWRHAVSRLLFSPYQLQFNSTMFSFLVFFIFCFASSIRFVYSYFGTLVTVLQNLTVTKRGTNISIHSGFSFEICS